VAVVAFPAVAVVAAASEAGRTGLEIVDFRLWIAD
jgi:hypothetical protein